jgi:hypothetical protein
VGTGTGTGGGGGGDGGGGGQVPITITTSVVKPPTIKAALPTIYGQFASPLTPAVSAFTPAGEIPGQETGKKPEDVWNQESLREGLGI